MSDLVERLRTQISSASLGERKYERPMTWDEADFVLSEIALLKAENERLRGALMQCKIIAEQYQKENEESGRWQGSGKAQMKARAVAVRCGFLVGSLRKVINAALATGGERE